MVRDVTNAGVRVQGKRWDGEDLPRPGQRLRGGPGLIVFQQLYGHIKIVLQMGCLRDEGLEDLPRLLGIRHRLVLVRHGLKVEDTQVEQGFCQCELGVESQSILTRPEYS